MLEQVNNGNTETVSETSVFESVRTAAEQKQTLRGGMKADWWQLRANLKPLADFDAKAKRG